MNKKPEKTQKTDQGAEIPIPKRKDVMRDLLKVSKPKPDPESKSDSSPKQQG